MVYCGKPSKGCKTCRERKIRCDTRTPSCTQCVKAKRKCPGYRNQLDLMFRDESQAVIEKASGVPKSTITSFETSSSPPDLQSPSTQATGTSPLSQIKTPITDSLDAEQVQGDSLIFANDDFSFLDASGVADIVTSSKDDFELEPFNGSLELVGPALGVPVYLAPCLEDQARSFFLTTYVFGDGSGRHGSLSYLPEVYKPGDWDDPLTYTIEAVSLATLGQSRKYDPLLNKANKSYVAALRATNAALADPHMAAKDNILAAVHLLGVYETVTCAGKEAIDSWSNHVQGATALLKLRGKKSLRSPVGLRLFLQTLSSIFIACIKNDQDMPKELISLRDSVANYFDENDPAWVMAGDCIKVIQLRARMHTDDALKVLREAQEFDRHLMSVSETYPEDWTYKVYFTDAYPELVYGGYYFEYGNQWKAQVANNNQTFRILNYEVLFKTAARACSPLSGKISETEFRQIVAYIKSGFATAIHEFCAAVPCQAGYSKVLRQASWSADEPSRNVPPANPTREASNSSGLPSPPDSPERHRGWPDIGNLENAQRTSPHIPLSSLFDVNRGSSGPQFSAANAHLLTFPFYLIGSAPDTPLSMTLWLSQRLEELSITFGVRQAYVLSCGLKKCAAAKPKQPELVTALRQQ